VILRFPSLTDWHVVPFGQSEPSQTQETWPIEHWSLWQLTLGG
jgi:hypothetical protein